MARAGSSCEGEVTRGSVVATDIPARLDRLPWGRFQTLVVTALGITWILDGLEVTLVGAVAGALKQSPVLQLSNTQVGLASSAYLAGAVLGAIFFGWLTDRLGRKKLFFITLGVYLVATAATALSWNFWSFALFRFLTGAGIGGEYTAINSTIQELVPARVRGWTDLAINGSFWVGAAVGAAGSIVLLDPSLLPADIGWRAAFAIGAALSLTFSSCACGFRKARAGWSRMVVLPRLKPSWPGSKRGSGARATSLTPVRFRRYAFVFEPIHPCARWHRRCCDRSDSAPTWG